MTFGKWLASKRDAAHLTQGQLAKRISVSVSYISALERDEPNAKDGSPRRPRIEKVDALAKALGTDLNEARLAAGYAPNRPEDNHDILDIAHFGFMANADFTPEEKERILDSVRLVVAGAISKHEQGKE